MQPLIQIRANYEQDQDERFQRIINLALELFEDKEEIQRWLSTPKAILGG